MPNDSRFQTDAYDARLRTWTMQMDTHDVRAVGDEVPDMAWVQLTGAVIDRPRIVAHRYGDRRESSAPISPTPACPCCAARSMSGCSPGGAAGVA